MTKPINKERSSSSSTKKVKPNQSSNPTPKNNPLTNHATKKEELIQVAKKLKAVEEEKLDIQRTIDQNTPSEQEMNIYNNRLKINREKLTELSAEAQDLQSEVEKLGDAASDNEKEIQQLQQKISQAENELEYNREMVKVKERMVKG